MTDKIWQEQIPEWPEYEFSYCPESFTEQPGFITCWQVKKNSVEGLLFAWTPKCYRHLKQKEKTDIDATYESRTNFIKSLHLMFPDLLGSFDDFMRT